MADWTDPRGRTLIVAGLATFGGVPDWHKVNDAAVQMICGPENLALVAVESDEPVGYFGALSLPAPFHTGKFLAVMGLYGIAKGVCGALWFRARKEARDMGADLQLQAKVMLFRHTGERQCLQLH